MSGADNDFDLSNLDTPEFAPDVLGREVFASTIARGLSRNRPNESLITAVYGPWGSGKSWLKHRILKDLADRENELTMVEFSPWQIRGVDELTLQFFAQVHEKLSANLEEKPRRLKKREKMWMALARLSGAGASALKVIGGSAALDPSNQVFAPALMAAAGVSEQFAKLLQSAGEDIHEKSSASPANAEDARRVLAKLFTETGTPSLLVVMDDFDRLTSEEIQTLVRLIKANANFPGLNYLIICDPDHLAGALDPISSNKGESFLRRLCKIQFGSPRQTRMPSSDSWHLGWRR
jgi:predicted KAP-like P-loop ATPase